MLSFIPGIFGTLEGCWVLITTPQFWLIFVRGYILTLLYWHSHCTFVLVILSLGCSICKVMTTEEHLFGHYLLSILDQKTHDVSVSGVCLLVDSGSDVHTTLQQHNDTRSFTDQWMANTCILQCTNSRVRNYRNYKVRRKHAKYGRS